MAEPPLRRAAQYVRMSTEHQKYSIAYQSHVNAEYAAQRGYEIVRTYADPGVSGLTLKKRTALQGLLADVLGGTCDFSVIIVYDISRWGRFQDPDESAHYEFICRQAGVAVEYAAEPFENDTQMISVLVKNLKRAMAAEYVRELAAKVRQSQEGLSRLGFWMGGPAPYGFRRCIVSPDGTPIARMECGERKALQGQRTVLVAGPEAEVRTVRRIFRLYVVDGLKLRSIANLLNAEGTPGLRGAVWSEWRVRKVITDEKYVGTVISGRYATHLGHTVKRPTALWRRVRGACPVLVNSKMFDVAQLNVRHHEKAGTDEELLTVLRGVLARQGRLSCRAIDLDLKSPCTAVFRRRFGSLDRAFELIGYQRTPVQLRMVERLQQARPKWRLASRPRREADEVLPALRALLRENGYLNADLINRAPSVPTTGWFRVHFGSLERVYEIVGYVPTRDQRRRLKSTGTAGTHLNPLGSP